jgi:hypothetical protein
VKQRLLLARGKVAEDRHNLLERLLVILKALVLSLRE